MNIFTGSRKGLVRKELKINSEWRERSSGRKNVKRRIKYTSSEKVPVGEK